MPLNNTKRNSFKDCLAWEIFEGYKHPLHIHSAYRAESWPKCSKSRDLVRLRFAIRIANRKSLAICDGVRVAILLRFEKGLKSQIARFKSAIHFTAICGICFAIWAPPDLKSLAIWILRFGALRSWRRAFPWLAAWKSPRSFEPSRSQPCKFRGLKALKADFRSLERRSWGVRGMYLESTLRIFSGQIFNPKRLF